MEVQIAENADQAPQKQTYGYIDEKIHKTLETPGIAYFVMMAILGMGILMMFAIWGYQVYRGLGVTGLNNPVGWGVYITTFVFWVGIGHSGTLISAVLFLFRAPWRNAIYRAAEAMTVFAVMTAGMFPLIHLGRVWRMYYILPYPNQRGLWPNFMSPLLWDVLAISTYLSVSSMFFFMGLIPDLATLRDRSTGIRKMVYGTLALGWKGSDQQWRNYSMAYLLFASLATPLVISVHSVVSWDFATSGVPGWHTTIFAPYFVAGAIHSGLAMVITVLIPLRIVFNVKDIVTMRHFEAMAKMLILTGCIVAYAYATEFFIAWYSGNRYEYAQFIYRATGDFAIPYWTMVTCNCVVPIFFFFKFFRRNIPFLFVASLLINVGMWFERFNIIVISLAKEYLPFGFDVYWGSWAEYGIMVGSFCMFFFLFFGFSKFFPAVAITEVKELLPPPRKEEGHS